MQVIIILKSMFDALFLFPVVAEIEIYFPMSLYECVLLTFRAIFA